MTNKKNIGRKPGSYPELVLFPGVIGQMRLGYNRMKAQAKYRKEQFELTWEQYQLLWEGKWQYKGRGINNLCLSKHDWDGPWTYENSVIMTRREQFEIQNRRRVIANKQKRLSK